MRATQAIASVPWAITEPALAQMVSIARRESLQFDAQKIEAIQARLGKQLGDAYEVEVRDRVAIIPIAGPTFRHANLFTAMSGATSIEMTALDFNRALDSDDVDAILFNIDSPGGEVNGTEEFSSMIYAARSKKPVWAYIAHEGASAAYWIASAAGHIVAAPTAMVGSIGVVSVQRLPDDDGQTVQIVSSQSPKKRLDLKTKEGRNELQVLVDDIAEVFVSTVARNRGVTVETVLDNYGQGGVFVGDKSVTNGMADELGSFESALAGLVASVGGDQTKPGVTIVIETDSTSNAPTPAAVKNTVVAEVTKLADAVPVMGNSDATRRNGVTSLMDRVTAALAPIIGQSNGEVPAASTTNDSAAEAVPAVAVTTPEPVAAGTTTTEVQPMQDQTNGAAATPTVANATQQAVVATMSASERENALIAENRRLKMERFSADARVFVQSALTARRAFPSEADHVTALYVQAAMDDNTYGALDNGHTRVSLLTASFNARPQHQMTVEQLTPALAQVLGKISADGNAEMAHTKEEPLSAEALEALMNRTTLGASVVRDLKTAGASK